MLSWSVPPEEVINGPDTSQCNPNKASIENVVMLEWLFAMEAHDKSVCTLDTSATSQGDQGSSGVSHPPVGGIPRKNPPCSASSSHATASNHIRVKGMNRAQ